MSDPYDYDQTPHGAREQLEPGQIVTHTYQDRYTGDGTGEATQHGIVLAVDPATDVATVAWFPGPSEIPAGELQAG